MLPAKSQSPNAGHQPKGLAPGEEVPRTGFTAESTLLGLFGGWDGHPLCVVDCVGLHEAERSTNDCKELSLVSSHWESRLQA